MKPNGDDRQFEAVGDQGWARAAAARLSASGGAAGLSERG